MTNLRFEEAYILWGEMRHPKGCVLLDLSETGARLRVFGVGELPQILTLLVPRLGLRAQARVAWQRGRECGLEFLEAAESERAQKETRR